MILYILLVFLLGGFVLTSLQGNNPHAVVLLSLATGIVVFNIFIPPMIAGPQLSHFAKPLLAGIVAAILFILVHTSGIIT
jgi:hypothetical protein